MDFGGHMRFTYGGASLTMRGRFELEPVDLNVTVGTNDDGSIYQTGKPEAQKLICNFEDPAAPSFSWDTFMKSGPQNVTLAEDDTGVTHICTAVKFSGRVKVNRLDGTVEGIEGHIPRGGYQRRNG